MISPNILYYPPLKFLHYNYIHMQSENKTIAVEFLEMVIVGTIDEAYEKHVDMQGKHHNAFTPAGLPALRDGMKEAHVKFPNKQFAIQHVIGDEELVAVHSRLMLELGKDPMAVVHLMLTKKQHLPSGMRAVNTV
jgi:predicted SnoaL-like aldol condensation-catalyzing enzyme